MTEQEPFSSLVVYHEWSCSSSEHSPEDSFEGSFESKVGLRPSEKDDTDIDFNSDEICAMMALGLASKQGKCHTQMYQRRFLNGQ